MVLSELFDRLAPVGGFRHPFHIRLPRDRRSDGFAKQRMVVCRETSNHQIVPPGSGGAAGNGDELSGMHSAQECSTLLPCLFRVRPAT
jgi:hypothetical protein